MHTFNGKKTRIHYNSDMSGDCNVINTENNKEITVPCEDLIGFVADYVRNQKIGKLEQMDSKEIFGLE